MDVVAEIRRFSRFYTRLIGLLDEHLPASGLSLTEGRVMYELATGGRQTAADLTRTLGVDKAQLSRVVHTLAERQLLVGEVDPAHAKRRLLSLTPAGWATFAELDHGTRLRMEAVLSPLTDAERTKLVGAMREIQVAFPPQIQVAVPPRDTAPAATSPAAMPAAAPGPVDLRAPVPGDLGWVIHRQAFLYAREYGWDWTYEALIARILGEFATDFDAAREAGWIAVRTGQIVGSIFLMRSDDPLVGRLRLLYVEPEARGAGIGRRLVDTCVERARQVGYQRLTLWTNDVLAAARRIYEAAGFRLTSEDPHRSFGQDLIGQTWELDL